MTGPRDSHRNGATDGMEMNEEGLSKSRQSSKANLLDTSTVSNSGEKDFFSNIMDYFSRKPK